MPASRPDMTRQERIDALLDIRRKMLGRTIGAAQCIALVYEVSPVFAESLLRTVMSGMAASGWGYGMEHAISAQLSHMVKVITGERSGLVQVQSNWRAEDPTDSRSKQEYVG